MVPTNDTAPSGTCDELTARLASGDGVPVSGAVLDVHQVLSSATTEPEETQELAFCNPTNPNGPNPTGQGGTAFGDVSGNNQASTPGQAGRNTVVHAEVGPTDANGEVTFGVTTNSARFLDDVVVTTWWELEDDDELDEGEPWDSSTITWVHNEDRPISVDAVSETATRPNGGRHEVTVRVTTTMGAVGGVVPSSAILPDASGRLAGDVADPTPGPSPNFSTGQAAPATYSCTATDAQGMSTCAFQDPLTTGPGTDTVVFFVDEGERGLDAGDPQDGVQVTWTESQQPPPTPPPTTAPSPTPGPANPGARNVRLCHGTASPAACDVAAVTRQAGDEHLLAALVTDRTGDPLGGVPVQFRVEGVGAFEPGGAASVLATTGADGVAYASLTSGIDGVSSIVAEISPPGSAGSLRGPGPSDDECEQPAGAGGSPGAGNCVSQMLTVSWHDELPAICSDGLDNDGDGFVDFEEDPGCTSEADDSETPAPHPDPPVVPHDRTVNMRFRDRGGPGDGALVIFGRVRLAGDDGHRRCKQGQPVRIQRRVDGAWKTVENATTNRRGRYAAVLFDRPGRYRAVALRTTAEDGVMHVCRKAVIGKTHHHRG